MYCEPRNDRIELVRERVTRLAFALARGDEITDDIRAMAMELAQSVGWAVLKPQRYQDLLTAWMRAEGGTAHMGVWYYRRGPLGLPLTPDDFAQAQAEGRPTDR
jgi:hypothetical protein